MHAIILSAGQGTRLRPLTNNCPKSMVQIRGKSILDRQIDLFYHNNIKDITLVKGYQPNSVSTHYSVKFYTNEYYQDTNMVYSLFCASDQLIGDTIISYGDIIYSNHVLNKMITNSYDIAVAVDLSWKDYYADRFTDPYTDAESLIFNDKFEIVDIGRRLAEPEDIMAQFIGLIKVSSTGAQIFNHYFLKFMEDNRKIGWGRSIKTAYMTDFLQELINLDIKIHAIPITRGWFEIDSLQDYELVERQLTF